MNILGMMELVAKAVDEFVPSAGEQWRVLANGISNRGAHDMSGTRLPGINVSMSRINQNVRSGHAASHCDMSAVGPISDIAQHSITLIGATVMQSSTAHAFRQYHQNTPTIPSTPAATKTKINAEFSIQAIAGMPSAMISPRRQICQERT
jgi:hypothetical protein